MKLCFFALFFILILPTEALAQDYLIEAKSVSSVYEVQNSSRQELYDDILSYFNAEENADAFTIAMENREQANIKVEQTSQVFYKNLGKLMYPNRSGMAELLSAEFIYHHEITVSEGSYMIRSELIGMNKEIYRHDDLFFECIDFEEIEEGDLKVYNESMDKFLKLNVVFKGRRQIFMDNARSQFEDASQNILNNMLSEMANLHAYLKAEELGMK